MHGALQSRIEEARKIERTLVRGDARLCSSIFGRVCKAVWPIKTAENLAAAAGYKSARTAAYEISGEREPSARAVAAIVVAITNRNLPG